MRKVGLGDGTATCELFSCASVGVDGQRRGLTVIMCWYFPFYRGEGNGCFACAVVCQAIDTGEGFLFFLFFYRRI